jgi:hypothetical protein
MKVKGKKFGKSSNFGKTLKKLRGKEVIRLLGRKSCRLKTENEEK